MRCLALLLLFLLGLVRSTSAVDPADGSVIYTTPLNIPKIGKNVTPYRTYFWQWADDDNARRTQRGTLAARPSCIAQLISKAYVVMNCNDGSCSAGTGGVRCLTTCNEAGNTWEVGPCDGASSGFTAASAAAAGGDVTWGNGTASAIAHTYAVTGNDVVVSTGNSGSNQTVNVTGTVDTPNLMNLSVSNAGTGLAIVTASAVGTPPGDALLRVFSGGQFWNVGIDASASNGFAISPSTLGSGNVLQCTTAGACTFPDPDGVIITGPLTCNGGSTGCGGSGFNAAASSNANGNVTWGNNTQTGIAWTFDITGGTDTTLSMDFNTHRYDATLSSGLFTGVANNGTGSAILFAQTGGGGDAYTRYTTQTGGQSWAIGQDFSAGNAFAIAQSGTPGSNTLGFQNVFQCTTAGLCSFPDLDGVSIAGTVTYGDNTAASMLQNYAVTGNDIAVTTGASGSNQTVNATGTVDAPNTMNLSVSNAGTGLAIVQASALGTPPGDAMMRVFSGGQFWAFGVDASASNGFAIAPGTLGSGNVLQCTTAGACSFPDSDGVTITGPLTCSGGSSGCGGGTGFPAIIVTDPAYGAVGDGTTDNCTAWGLVDAAVPAQGAQVIIPAGTYLSTCPLKLRQQSVYQGAGAGATILQTPTTGTGFALMQVATPRTCTGGSGAATTCDDTVGGSTRGPGCVCYTNADCSAGGTCTGGTVQRNTVVRNLKFSPRVAGSMGIDFGLIGEGAINQVEVTCTASLADTYGYNFSDGGGTVGGYSNTLSQSKARQCKYGVRVMDRANDTRIVNNAISTANDIGIQLDFPTHGTKVYGNTIQSNTTKGGSDFTNNTWWGPNYWEDDTAKLVIEATSTNAAISGASDYSGAGADITNNGTGATIDGVPAGTPPDCSLAGGTRCQAAPAGVGDVRGPNIAIDNVIARFDLSTGKLIQNSACVIDDAGGVDCAAPAGTVGGSMTLKEGAGETGTNTFTLKVPNAGGLTATKTVTLTAPGNFPASAVESAGTTAKCARFDAAGVLIAASGDCAAGDTSSGSPASIIRSYTWRAPDLDVDTTGCTMVAVAQVGSGPLMRTINCLDAAGGGIFGRTFMPSSWNAGTVQLALQGFSTSAAPTGETLAFDVSCMVRGDDDLINNTWGTSQLVTLVFSVQNRSELVITPALTCNGAAPGKTIYWRAVTNTAGTSTTQTNVRVSGAVLSYTAAYADEVVPTTTTSTTTTTTTTTTSTTLTAWPDSDLFERANGALGANWTTWPGMSAPAIINTSDVTGSVAAADNAAYWNANTFPSNDTYVCMKTAGTALASGSISVCIMNVGANDMLCCENNSTTGNIKAWWNDNGTFHQDDNIGSTGLTPGGFVGIKRTTADSYGCFSSTNGTTWTGPLGSGPYSIAANGGAIAANGTFGIYTFPANPASSSWLFEQVEGGTGNLPATVCGTN